MQVSVFVDFVKKRVKIGCSGGVGEVLAGSVELVVKTGPVEQEHAEIKRSRLHYAALECILYLAFRFRLLAT